MSGPALTPVIGYGLLCTLSLAAGGAIAAYRPAGDRLRSIFQHAAAGLVFAAAGIEVLPDVMHRHLPLAATIGFGIGIVVLLLIRAVSDKLCTGGGATALIAVVVVDIFIDGLLIGVSSATARGGGQQALLITIALAVELLTLGLSIAAELTENGTGRRRIVVTTSTVALTPLAGAVAGYFLGGALSGAWVEAVLAFAVAALLYLAAEELLTEAHETEETAAGTAVLLFAFLAIMIIHMLTAPG